MSYTRKMRSLRAGSISVLQPFASRSVAVGGQIDRLAAIAGTGSLIQMTITTITGKLATGLGKATGFTELDWAKAAFIDRLGIDPFPGTVNLIVATDTDRDAWRRVKEGAAIVISPPRTDWCDALCYPASIETAEAAPIRAAIVLPDVAGYAPDQIELIAPVGIRDALRAGDGDAITIHVEQGEG